MRARLIAIAMLACGLLSVAPARADCDHDSFRDATNVTGCDDETEDLREAGWHRQLADPNLTLPAAETNLAALVATLRRDFRLQEELRDWLGTRLDHVLGDDSVEGSAFVRVEASSIEPGDVDAFGCSCSFRVGVSSEAGQPLCVVVKPEDATRDNGQCTHRAVVSTPTEAARYVEYIDASVRGLVRLGADARREHHVALRQVQGRWRNLLVRGYPQFPWELMINGAQYEEQDFTAFNPDDLEPSRFQMIAFHPTLAVGLQGFGNGPPKVSAQGVISLGIEIFGVLGYTKSLSHYFGVSGIVTVDNLDLEDPRFGALLHITRFIHVGFAWSPREDDGTLMVSVDLFGWAQRAASLAGQDLPDPSLDGEQ